MSKLLWGIAAVGALALWVGLVLRPQDQPPAVEFMDRLARADGSYWQLLCPQGPAWVPREAAQRVADQARQAYQRRGLSAQVHLVGTFQRPEGGSYWYFAVVFTERGESHTDWYVVTVRDGCIWSVE